MAAGDELIDHFDQSLVRNRVVDATVEVMFAGAVQVWKPGETRMITTAYVPHFLKGATLCQDPTNINAPIQSLVVVDQTGAATMPGASVEPLTAADVAELTRYGIMDESNLPTDRYIDDATGQPQTRRELLRVNRGFDTNRRRLAPSAADVAPVIDSIAESLVIR